jgi:hypothetical protein
MGATLEVVHHRVPVQRREALVAGDQLARCGRQKAHDTRCVAVVARGITGKGGQVPAIAGRVGGAGSGLDC